VPEPTPLRFRPAATTDVDAVVALVQSAYRGDASRAGWTTEADLIEGQRTDAAMVAETLDRSDARILLAEHPETGRLMACAEIAEYRGPGGGGYFGMFAVDPALQGRGVGAAVLDEIERIVAHELGHDRLVLVVISLRTEMIDLYARRGFIPTGEMHAFPYGDERYGRPVRDDLELLVMAKDLSTPPK
jgi:ribosomal protein S18 acetylase RimI-like enzyme